jgi:hypothetical protein
MSRARCIELIEPTRHRPIAAYTAKLIWNRDSKNAVTRDEANVQGNATVFLGECELR